MSIYPKIPGPFKREYGTSKILTDEWTTQELGFLYAHKVPFEAYEKVDGTNVRVIWDGYRVTFAGRTDNAQFPPGLLAWLDDKFGGPENESGFEEKFGPYPAVLYGEGYGPKIQKGGGKYRDDISVVFYDMKIEDYWLRRQSMQDIAKFFHLELVPFIARGTLSELISLVSSGIESRWGGPDGLAGPRDYFTAEGVVATTELGLKDRQGERIIVKIKGRDFPIE